jgi:hypothetical protein
MQRLHSMLQQIMRDIDSILYEPSGLDEFHPDATHNPDPVGDPV